MEDNNLRKLLYLTYPFLSASTKKQLEDKADELDEELSYDPHSFYAPGGIMDNLHKALPCWMLTEGELPYMKKEEVLSYMAALEELCAFLTPFYEKGQKDFTPLYKNENLYREDRPDLSDEEHIRLFMNEIRYCPNIKNPYVYRIEKDSPMKEDSFRILNPYHIFDANKYEDLDYPNREFTLPRAKYLRLKRIYDTPAPVILSTPPVEPTAPPPPPPPAAEFTYKKKATGGTIFAGILIYILLPLILLGGSGFYFYNIGVGQISNLIFFNPPIGVIIYGGIAFFFTFIGAILDQLFKPASLKDKWTSDRIRKVSVIQSVGFWINLVVSSFALGLYIPFLNGLMVDFTDQNSIILLAVGIGLTLVAFLFRLPTKSYKGGRIFFLQPLILPILFGFGYAGFVFLISHEFDITFLILGLVPILYLLLDGLIPVIGKRLWHDYYDPREPSPIVKYLYGFIGYFLLPAAMFGIAFGLFHLYSMFYAMLETPFISYDGSNGITPLLSEYKFWITVGIIIVPSTLINIFSKKWMKILHRIGFDTYSRGENQAGPLRAFYGLFFYVGFVLLMFLYYRPIMYRNTGDDAMSLSFAIVIAAFYGVPFLIRVNNGAPASFKILASCTLFGLTFHAANLMAFSPDIFIQTLLFETAFYGLPYFIINCTRPSGYIS